LGLYLIFEEYCLYQIKAIIGASTDISA